MTFIKFITTKVKLVLNFDHNFIVPGMTKGSVTIPFEEPFLASGNRCILLSVKEAQNYS